MDLIDFIVNKENSTKLEAIKKAAAMISGVPPKKIAFTSQRYFSPAQRNVKRKLKTSHQSSFTLSIISM